MCDTERVKEKEIDRDDKNFPEKLKSELVRPIVKKLWYRGKWNSKLFEKCAAVVGARKMSRYGKQALGEIIPKLCGAGYTIVSGLMYGVDQEAHKLTLECGGCAIAVLGYGTQRNRIVVGISDVIVVAEAGEKSGSLNTASWARRMNKPVYAIPGSVFSPTSEGTNWLVAQGLAKALTVTESQ
ncbi:MAG: protecting protein, SMF familiy protein [Microgenomates group bacterium GW2011_GWF1_46_12]|nr:MAG: protecting protein, SMF familiy protein [Microgenomates group bacterium GW2011_GWF1_46_12]